MVSRVVDHALTIDHAIGQSILPLGKGLTIDHRWLIERGNRPSCLSLPRAHVRGLTVAADDVQSPAVSTLGIDSLPSRTVPPEVPGFGPVIYSVAR